eukprot:415684-Hanusia_phi.AAC.1
MRRREGGGEGEEEGEERRRRGGGRNKLWQVVVRVLAALTRLRVFLTRGNHEFREMNERVSIKFRDAADAGAGPRRWVPWASGTRRRGGVRGGAGDVCLASSRGDRLVVYPGPSSSASTPLIPLQVLHGGIGHGSWGLRELREAHRPRREEGVQQDCVHQVTVAG